MGKSNDGTSVIFNFKNERHFTLWWIVDFINCLIPQIYFTQKHFECTVFYFEFYIMFYLWNIFFFFCEIRDWSQPVKLIGHFIWTSTFERLMPLLFYFSLPAYLESVSSFRNCERIHIMQHIDVKLWYLR